MLFSPVKTKNRTNFRFSILVQEMHRTYFLSPSLFHCFFYCFIDYCSRDLIIAESKERTYGIEKKEAKIKVQRRYNRMAVIT
jgi:hypothetical protein